MGLLHSSKTHITLEVLRIHEIGVLGNITWSPGHDLKNKGKKEGKEGGREERREGGRKEESGILISS